MTPLTQLFLDLYLDIFHIVFPLLPFAAIGVFLMALVRRVGGPKSDGEALEVRPYRPLGDD